MPYNVLCKLIEPEQFIECLIELCKVFNLLMTVLLIINPLDVVENNV